eukprot:7867349-Lingulodinium_polyedra.AAC.1
MRPPCHPDVAPAGPLLLRASAPRGPQGQQERHRRADPGFADRWLFNARPWRPEGWGADQLRH